jgi:hypothetical protein
MKVYLQTKGLQIIKEGEAMALMQQEMKDAFSRMPISSSEASGQDYAKKLMASYKTVAQRLNLVFYSDRRKQDKYIIDSIDWKLQGLPPKDSGTIFMRVYPSINSRGKNYPFLKEFVDVVLTSGLLQ